RPPGARSLLGADRRRELLGLHLRLPPDARADRGRGAGDAGRPRRAQPQHPGHVPPAGEQGQRLPDRPRGAAARRDVLGRARDRAAGRVAAGEHGPDRRPDEGAARLLRHRDHQGAAEAPPRDRGAPRRGRDASRRRHRPPPGALGGRRPAAGRALRRGLPRGARGPPRGGPRVRLSAMRPILASSCARAATAAEARFRIGRPIGGRSARVVALDGGAAGVVERVARERWQGARFFTGAAVAAEELADADLLLMVATAGDGADAAAALARACAERGIMTAGLIVGEAAEAVTALRPYARVLMVTEDERDVAEVLTALRA